MRKRKALLIDLAAHRELTPEQRQEIVQQLPEAGRTLAAYQEQDELLAALPRPQVPARAMARIVSATTNAARPQRPNLAWQRWAVPGLVVLAFLAMLTSAGYAAAQSLPGEGWYGVKRAGERARLALMAREESRLAYEQQLEERRRGEIRALLAQGRQGVPIAFTGLLQQENDGEWTVAGLPVELPSAMQPTPGLQVRVEGWTEEGRVRARLMAPQPTPAAAPRPGPSGAPQGSPTGSAATRAPQATPTASPTGAGEPQHQQRGTATTLPTGAAPTATPRATAKATSRAETAAPSATPAATATANQKHLGQTPAATAAHTPEPGPTAAPQEPTSAPQGPTSAPQGPTAAPQGPTAAPQGPTAAPQGPTSAPQGPTAAPQQPEPTAQGPGATPVHQGEPRPTPGANGAGSSEPRPTSATGAPLSPAIPGAHP